MFRGWKGRRAATAKLMMVKLEELKSTLTDMNKQLANDLSKSIALPAAALAAEKGQFISDGEDNPT